MIVLKIIGLILLSLLAIIIIALCIKVKITAEYSEDNTNVRLRWLFLEFPLYPSEKKEKKKPPEEDLVNEDSETAEETPENETEETPENESAAKEENQAKKESLLHIIYRTQGIDGIILIVKRIFSYTGTFIGEVLNSVIVEEFELEVCCTRKDAASTAIYYGEISSVLFPMLGKIVSKYKVKNYNINIYPDFLAKHSSASFYVCLYARPIRILGAAVAFAFKLIFGVLLKIFVKIFLPENKTQKIEIKKKTEKSDL